MHDVRTFAPCKAYIIIIIIIITIIILLFILIYHFFILFSSLENYFGFRAINVKGKTDLCVSLKWNRNF